MAVFARRTFVDYWSPVGVSTLTDIGYLSTSGTTGSPRSAKVDKNGHHYVLYEDGTNMYLNVAIPNSSSGSLMSGSSLNFTSLTSAAQTIIYHSGAAMLPTGDIVFIDSLSDNVYQLTHDMETVHSIINIGVMSGANTPYSGLCFNGRSFVVGGYPGSGTNDNLHHVRIDQPSGVFTEGASIAARTTGGLKAVAYNGRDYIFVTVGTTVPATSYNINIVRPAPGTSGNGPGYVLGTGSFQTGSGDVIDADWDGRNWLVYKSEDINIGA